MRATAVLDGRPHICSAAPKAREQGAPVSLHPDAQPCSCGLLPLPTSCPAAAHAKDGCGTYPDEVRRYTLGPRLEPGIDERRALALGIQMMCRSARQDEPPLARFLIDLVDLHGDLVVGVRNTGAQVLVKDGSHVPKTIDSPSILYATGSAVSPYRLVKTRRATPRRRAVPCIRPPWPLAGDGRGRRARPRRSPGQLLSLEYDPAEPATAVPGRRSMSV